MTRLLALTLTLFLSLTLAAPTFAQQAEAPAIDRSATGGAPTLEDILARQRGEAIDHAERRANTGDPDSAAEMAAQLGTLGGASDPELWRALRFGTADVSVSNDGPAAGILVQDSGMAWLQFREGPLQTYGAYLLGGTLIALLVFYLLRGRVMIDGEKTGRTVLRFAFIERFAHWLMAGSFVLLGLTGLLVLFGRKVVIPLVGHEAFTPVAIGAKFIHNNVSWAFMVGLAMAFVFWVVHNLPSRHDVVWILRGGGLFGGGHPPAKKFNAGQKVIFWSVMILGGSISLSGLSLLFPFEIPMFAKTFALLNQVGVGEMVGYGPLPEALAPHTEMQLAQAWHAIVSFVLMAIIIAHIYIGSLGMEGAYDAMGSGQVEEQWAREHHSIWLDEVKAKEAEAPAGARATPAE
ncbi:formate dehydrogenase subunit gamma [Jannaschia pagri]|uniref:Formate dehydrogenase subunit gamma n=1 Tax=Jannaschia pagri TaxID=2829797 RepID=A0ABQ4NL65_9RHOB|nr:MULTISPECIES: cytochrome b/b6 domain-containing protein [unclassified Jannaschia]GIT91322.1 formate dehydrogenase subunit gamma [Jannaschia sp. AI_61]GIT95155.1 formate dehydrogenase subunit gamma [Jannaschia sp. AI_62]